MSIDLQKQRVADLNKAIEQSVANHNLLVGRLHEAQFQLQYLEDQAKLKLDNEPVIWTSNIVE